MKIRSLIKEVVYGTVRLLGVPAVGRGLMRNGLVVLTYHSFCDADEHPYLNRMPITRFARQLRYLEKHYEIVSIEDGLRRLDHDLGREQTRPLVAITVDDGFCDNYELLFPLVSARKIPITVFVVTDYINSGRLPWPTRVNAALIYSTRDELCEPIKTSILNQEEKQRAGETLRHQLSRLAPEDMNTAVSDLERALKTKGYSPVKPLTWDQLREMRCAGVSIGSHTCFHSWLDRIDSTQVEMELTESKSCIEAEIGEPCLGIAYPNGNWNTEIAALARKVGYAYGLTQDRGVNRRIDCKPHSMKRIEVPFNELIGSFSCRTAGVTF